MKSTLKNMLLCLTAIACGSGAILAGVRLLTAEPAARAAEAALNEAIAEVLPPFDNNPRADVTTTSDGLTLYHATNGGANAGVAVETYSDNGFSGHISILAGFDASGRLTGYRVLEHAETPGLGARMGQWFNQSGTTHDVTGSSAPIVLTADGGNIDAITGATITSRAFTQAINRAREAATPFFEQ